MAEFNPRKARTKRPCPFWADAFLRDTQHLSADEIGAYLLILFAMWSRDECNVPDDNVRLARICRVSQRVWKLRIGPALRSFFKIESCHLVSKRLQREAKFVEDSCLAQSERRRGSYKKKGADGKPERNNKEDNTVEFSTRNTLKNIESPITVETTPVKPRRLPTQQPNNPTLDDGGEEAPANEDAAKQTHRERLLAAMGVDRTGQIGPNGALLGTSVDMTEVKRWFGLGLTEDEQITVVVEVMAKKSGGPLHSFKYFTSSMYRLAEAKVDRPLNPPDCAQHSLSSPPPQSRIDMRAVLAQLNPDGTTKQ